MRSAKKAKAVTLRAVEVFGWDRRKKAYGWRPFAGRPQVGDIIRFVGVKGATAGKALFIGMSGRAIPPKGNWRAKGWEVREEALEAVYCAVWAMLRRNSGGRSRP